MSKVLKQIREAVEEGEIEEVAELTEEALEDESAQSILNDGLLEGMNIVGELFRSGEMFVPEVLMSAKAVDAGMEILKPHLKSGDIKVAGKVVFCTVAGDLHDIGKKLCVMLMQGGGFEVIDLGVDVGSEQIVAAVKEHNPDVVAMSAMLTTTMEAMDETIKALKNNGLHVKVMVGGAPLSNQYAENIGASYSEDAIGAVELAAELVG